MTPQRLAEIKALLALYNEVWRGLAYNPHGLILTTIRGYQDTIRALTDLLAYVEELEGQREKR